MSMQPYAGRRIRSLALICLSTSFAGVIFQLIDEKRLDYNSLLIGFPLGLAFGVLELFVLSKSKVNLQRWSFLNVVLFKTVVYTAVIYAVTVMLLIIVGMFSGRQLSELPALLVSRSQLVLVIYTLVVYGLLVFFMQVNELLGEGVLWKFIRGKYRKPWEEERIFMFLDMKSSTSIAERLGHLRFYSLLNELFHEISEPILETGAEIYQYIGDEVVLTWEVEQGVRNSNCVNIFFIFKELLQKKREHYIKDFGVMPAFKAGLHFGKVVSAQIGDLKREIVYNGDVVNTTARIRDECNVYNRDCLVSGNLRAVLEHQNGFLWEKIGSVTLRGKEREIELFSLVKRAQ